jgi:hypothetical protein
MELRESGKIVSDTQTITIEIAGPRSYPDDLGSGVPTTPRASPSPRPSGATPGPRPSPGATPRGRTPAPTPTP